MGGCRMNTLLSVKRDLELGIRPRAFIVCPPTPEAPARKAIKRAPSSQNLSGAAAAAASRPTLRRRQPTLTAGVALFERFTIYETSTVRVHAWLVIDRFEFLIVRC